MNLELFKSENFGEIRAVDIDGKPYVVAKDIALALGYNKDGINTIIGRKCKGVTKRDTLTKGGIQQISLITEPDIYRLIFGSKLPDAEKFQDWVFEEVLPSIRKNGGYIIEKEEDTPEEIMARALVVAQETLKRREQRILELESAAEESKPMVEFANQVANSSDTIDIGEFAKVIRDQDIKLGRNKLFAWMRENKILMKNNVPYQRYIDNEWFKTDEVVKKTSYGDKVFIKTLITGLGQIRLLEKIRQESVA